MRTGSPRARTEDRADEVPGHWTEAERLYFGGDTALFGDEPLADLSVVVESACLVLNLEASLDEGRRAEKLVTSVVRPAQLDHLAGFRVVANIVNNHASDAGDPEHLAQALRKRGVAVLGPENPSITRIEVGGQTADLLAASFRLPRWRTDYDGRPAKRLMSMVKESEAGLRLVSLHWGYEHTDIPAPFQRRLASRLVAAGADLVVGHHPHVRQGWERIDGVPVFYSLGNLNFGLSSRPMEPRHRRGILLSYGLSEQSVELLPVTLDSTYRPQVDRAERRETALAEIAGLCVALERSDGDWYRQEYGRWYRGELCVWLKRCRENGRLWARFVLWLVLPLQLRYYLAVVGGWLGC